MPELAARATWKTPAPSLECSPAALPAGDLAVALATALAGRADAILLGTADDGLLWGRWNSGTLVTAWHALQGHAQHPHAGARLDRRTLASLRVFGPWGELRVWRAGGSLCAVWAAEAPEHVKDGATLDECHPLVGAGGVAIPGPSGTSFTPVFGTRGERHTPPVAWGQDQGAWLNVRHYLEWDRRVLTYQPRHTRWVSLELRAKE